MTTITFYRIYNDDLNLNYIGKTIDLNERIQDHKSICYNLNSNKYNIKVYKTIRENGGFDNFKVMKVDTIILDDIQCKKMEQSYIDLFNANLNTNNAYRSIENLKDYKQQYYKDYKETNKEKNKNRYIQYYNLNKQKINEKCSQYHNLNKQKINERKRLHYE